MAALIVEAAWFYSYAGLAVAALFLTVGIGRVAPDAAGAFAFRPLLVPGVVLFWPVVLWRWAQLERGARPGAAAHRPPRRAQDAATLALLVAIPATVAAALAIHQGPPDGPGAVQLDAPVDAAAEPVQ